MRQIDVSAFRHAPNPPRLFDGATPSLQHIVEIGVWLRRRQAHFQPEIQNTSAAKQWRREIAASLPAVGHSSGAIGIEGGFPRRMELTWGISGSRVKFSPACHAPMHLTVELPFRSLPLSSPQPPEAVDQRARLYHGSGRNDDTAVDASIRVPSPFA